MKVAIIGAGPRGLWAAQELAARLGHLRVQEGKSIPCDIAVFDPYPPGAGAVYRTDQPRVWRLNVRSDAVDAGHRSLDRWRLDRGEAAPLDPFPPRAVVGEYLQDCWSELLAELPDNLTVRHVPLRVRSVARTDGGFMVEGEFFDYVLAATGHPHTHDGALTNAPRAAGAPPVSSLYWGAQLPERPKIVGARGAALSFIDLCLYYQGSDTILMPVNRGGRFMEVKPDPGLASPDLSVFAPGIHSACSTAEIEDVLVRAAQSLVDGQVEIGEAELRAVIAGTDFSGDAVAELRRSLAIAKGHRAHSAASAIGMAFRELYQDIVDDMIARGGPLPGFFAMARHLERVAFGPPPTTAQVLVDMIDSGAVRTCFMGRPEALDAWMAGQAFEGIMPDVIVDATIAPQGLPHPFSELDGVTGFYATGRMNEHKVVGHDTLKRTIHQDIPRWAERIARDATASH